MKSSTTPVNKQETEVRSSVPPPWFQKRSLKFCKRKINKSMILGNILHWYNFEMNLFKKLRLIRVKPTYKSFSDCKVPGDNYGKSSPGFVTVQNMNKNIITMEYAVRGPLLTRASEIEKELALGKPKLFKKVIKANLGDCQAMGQPPITFYRQVLALLTYPQLMSDKSFPPDTVARAKELLSACRGGSVGSYSDSFGIELIRSHVAESIKRRDKYDSKTEDILLSAGASESIKNVLKLLNEKVDGKQPGVMIPIPQYPLYSATLAEFGMTLIGYYLKEKENWSLEVAELNRSLNEAKEYCNPRAIVIINPGNPTGQVLTRNNIEDVIKFAYTNKLVLMADEVYQSNVYAKGTEFHSFKKVINELGEPYNRMELASFMSCSKGYMGECGLRGAYCELVNFDSAVRANFSKSISAMLCPTVLGQCLLDCVVKPPVPGEPSYELYEKEKNSILGDLREKADIVYNSFNAIEGITCNVVQGAMYAFPKLDIPPKALEEAKKRNIPGDEFYAFELLENTGICVIPGSGFKQEPGTYHFRTTILPSKNDLKEMLKTFEDFHKQFLKKHR